MAGETPGRGQMSFQCRCCWRVCHSTGAAAIKRAGSPIRRKAQPSRSPVWSSAESRLSPAASREGRTGPAAEGREAAVLASLTGESLPPLPTPPDAAAQATPNKNCPITQGMQPPQVLTTAFKNSHTLPSSQADFPSGQV